MQTVFCFSRHNLLFSPTIREFPFETDLDRRRTEVVVESISNGRPAKQTLHITQHPSYQRMWVHGNEFGFYFSNDLKQPFFVQSFQCLNDIKQLSHCCSDINHNSKFTRQLFTTCLTVHLLFVVTYSLNKTEKLMLAFFIREWYLKHFTKHCFPQIKVQTNLQKAFASRNQQQKSEKNDLKFFICLYIVPL